MATAAAVWSLLWSRRELVVAAGATLGLLGVVAAVAGGVGHASHHGTAPRRHVVPAAVAFAAPRRDDDSVSPRKSPSPPAPAGAPAPSASAGTTTSWEPLPPNCNGPDLAGTLSTNRTAYSGGQTVFMTVTVRNVSAHACLAPATCNGIAVTITGDNGWVSDAGPRGMGCTVPMGWHPPALMPGQSLSQSAWWDQRKITCFFGCPDWFVYAPSGGYTATADWGDGVRATSPHFTISVPACGASDVALSLTADRGQYTAGEFVRLTSTVVQRPSPQSGVVTTCSLTRGGSSLIFSASSGPLQVWQSCVSTCGESSIVVLGPGVTLRVSATWDQTTCASGKSGCARAPSGNYQVTADWGPLGRVSQNIILE